MSSEYFSLLAGYATAMIGWLVLSRAMPWLWPPPPPSATPHPWREVGWALLALVPVLAIGWLWGAGWLLPKTGFYEVINQALIFSPLFVLLAIRRQPLSSAWIRTRRVWLRVLVGLGLALIAILAFTSVRAGSASWPAVVSRVYALGNASFAMQVFLEDVAIAILFVRFAAALGTRNTVLFVAVLFSLAHVPALLQSGASVSSLGHLVLDTLLAVGILAVLQRSADVWWFWMVHFAMDMMQFYGVAPP